MHSFLYALFDDNMDRALIAARASSVINFQRGYSVASQTIHEAIYARLNSAKILMTEIELFLSNYWHLICIAICFLIICISNARHHRYPVLYTWERSSNRQGPSGNLHSIPAEPSGLASNERSFTLVPVKSRDDGGFTGAYPPLTVMNFVTEDIRLTRKV